MAPSQATLDVLLDYLNRSRGFDFSGYKRASLERRIAKRMEAVEVESYLDYLDYLEVHPDEFPQLFNTILINVTGFFRDPAAWQYLAEQTIPEMLASKEDSDPIRAWSAGCASGEETYTLAILLAEALGEEAYRQRVKIYGTDVDDEALDEARRAVYSAKQVEAVPEELRQRYFERTNQRYVFRRDLRRTVIFGRNDLVQDAPISRVDLLVCRNTLIYFNAETQAHILRRFHFALNETGHLFLGRSEMLIAHADLFTPVDGNRRVFRAVQRTSTRERLSLATQPVQDIAIRDTAFDVAPIPQLVVDGELVLVQANRAARRLLGLGASDVGCPLKDLEAFHRPAELRGRLEAAMQSAQVVTLPPLAWADRQLEVTVTPLTAGGKTVGATVTYTDVTPVMRALEDLAQSRRELAVADEELRAAVEELESTNEEFQSTNEELETMNEELQSTNEELETMNDELRRRGYELSEVNAFMETILTGMGVGVIVVDRHQTVRVYNRHSEELWGRRPEEVEGQHILNLDIGLPVEELRKPLRSVLSGASERAELDMDAVDRRGRPVRCQATVLPVALPDDGITGAIVITERLGARNGA